MIRTRAVKAHPASALALLGALAATVLLFAPGARAAASITANPGNPTTVTGVSFTVTTGGGNRDFATVSVNCDNGYATTLTVEVPAKGTGTSATIYPPAGSCTADLTKEMQIGKARVLASVSFTMT